ncbi:MAG: hypothetical protein HQL28_07475 [Candidatus Omnitrophica bacterium]|nr:hypothetical protein [Candidatus Omnitrophota bacterium]
MAVKYRLIVLAGLVIGLLLPVVAAGAGGVLDGKRLSEYAARADSQEIVGKLSGNPRVAGDFRNFLRYFALGVEYYKIKEYGHSTDAFLRSREYWPEFFGVDLAIAMAFDGRGDAANAARFYKSYLLKLKKFREGEYRISAPIISFITEGKAEKYDDAEKEIREHLKAKGIDLDKVRPFSDSWKYVFICILTFAALAVCTALYKTIWPALKRWHRIHNPPEGFWVCRKCGARSPVLSNSCVECMRPRG